MVGCFPFPGSKGEAFQWPNNFMHIFVICFIKLFTFLLSWKPYFITVLIYISLNISNIKQFLNYLLEISTFLFV